MINKDLSIICTCTTYKLFRIQKGGFYMMSNVRKQTIVITVLIVLIACAGLFARNFNDTVKDSNALSQTVVETNKTMNYFADSRAQKENLYDKTKVQYNDLINNKQLSKKVHETASLNLIKLTDSNMKESKIETLIKGRGYDDALCMITEKNVEVCVKTDVELTAKQANEIKDIIVNTTKESPNNIYVKAKQ
jgi:stage III sporulation protein AH